MKWRFNKDNHTNIDLSHYLGSFNERPIGYSYIGAIRTNMRICCAGPAWRAAISKLYQDIRDRCTYRITWTEQDLSKVMGNLMVYYALYCDITKMVGLFRDPQFKGTQLPRAVAYSGNLILTGDVKPIVGSNLTTQAEKVMFTKFIDSVESMLRNSEQLIAGLPNPLFSNFIKEKYGTWFVNGSDDALTILGNTCTDTCVSLLDGSSIGATLTEAGYTLTSGETWGCADLVNLYTSAFGQNGESMLVIRDIKKAFNNNTIKILPFNKMPKSTDRKEWLMFTNSNMIWDDAGLTVPEGVTCFNTLDYKTIKVPTSAGCIKWCPNVINIAKLGGRDVIPDDVGKSLFLTPIIYGQNKTDYDTNTLGAAIQLPISVDLIFMLDHYTSFFFDSQGNIQSISVLGAQLSSNSDAVTKGELLGADAIRTQIDGILPTIDIMDIERPNPVSLEFIINPDLNGEDYHIDFSDIDKARAEYILDELKRYRSFGLKDKSYDSKDSDRPTKPERK